LFLVLFVFLFFFNNRITHIQESRKQKEKKACTAAELDIIITEEEIEAQTTFFFRETKTKR